MTVDSARRSGNHFLIKHRSCELFNKFSYAIGLSTLTLLSGTRPEEGLCDRALIAFTERVLQSTCLNICSENTTLK